MKLIFHAPNVHSGGGKTLLRAALQSVDAAQACALIADSRLDLQRLPAHIAVETFAPTIAGRLAAESRLRSLAASGDVVLCMGNLPPLLSCPGRVLVFLQNRYLCDDVSLRGFALRARLRNAFERLWLKLRLRQGMRVLVQTASMQRAARQALGVEALIMPFTAVTVSDAHREAGRGRARLLYPSSAEPHKNHSSLLAAWRILQQSGVDAELHLTIEENSPLAGEIERARKAGVAVVNHGHLEPQGLTELYRTCTALVFPSGLESFGLPLLEAQAAGLPIVAAERDYVRDVVEPVETFDPESPVSIARAVRRLLGAPEKPPPPLAPAEFIARIVADRV